MLPRIKRTTFWAETALAGAAGTLAVVTIFWRGWIEGLTGLDPDHGNGAFEVLLVAVLAAVSICAGLLARRTQRRIAPAAVCAPAAGR